MAIQVLNTVAGTDENLKLPSNVIECSQMLSDTPLESAHLAQLHGLTELPDVEFDTIRSAKGKYIDSGVSGIVELLPTGQVSKSAWPQDEDSRQDMATEALAYQRLLDQFGVHKRFVKQLSYDESERTITMERMENGTLRAYLEEHNDRISHRQRILWICALAEGMAMLHTANIIHCDFSPRNMLLDTTLELKVADFGCVSIDGAPSSAGGSVRFYLPRDDQRFEVDDDLFALGSSIFEVLTGKPPYSDLDREQIPALYATQQFPDLTGLDMRDIIRDCWLLRAHSAGEVHRRILELVAPIEAEQLPFVAPDTHM